jgi:glycosyltransferase involved in cell wall biosynthesis
MALEERMNLLFVDPMSYNHPGVYDICLLRNLKITHIVFFCNDLLHNNCISNVQIVKNYCYTNKKGIFKAISYIVSQFKLFFYILSNKPNIIHFQWFRIYILDYLLLLAIKIASRSMIVMTVHNVMPHNSGNRYFKIHKKIYSVVDGIIVHEKSAQNELIENFDVDHKKIRVIPHGITGKSKKKIENRKNMNQNIIKFALLGSLQEYKGIDVAIDAWKDPRISGHETFELLIAGKGKIPVTNIPDNVKIINRFLSDEEMYSFTESSDVLLFPYKRISQSGALLYTLSFRKPVIVSNIGGLTQPFEVAKIGWILEENTPKALSDLILYLGTHKRLIREIQNDTVEWNKVENFYSWNKIGVQTLRLYQSLLTDEFHLHE